MLKKILKWLGALLAVLVVLGTALFIHVWYFKPFDINLFFGRTALQFALRSPELLSSLRVLEPLGIDGHNARLDDESIAEGDAILAQVKAARATLERYDDADLDPADRLSKDIMLSLFELLDEGERFRFYNYPVNQLFGVQNGFPSFMESTHQIADLEDAEHYVARLNAVGLKFDQVLEGLRHRQALGVLPPQFVVDRVLEEMNAFVATPVAEGILMRALETKMTDAGLPAADQQRIAAEAAAAIETTVYPAYGRLIAYFEQLDEAVDDNYGFWKHPDGDQFYRLALKFFTTTDYTPEYIHAFGLAEVDRIQGEILAILAAEGWDVAAGFGAAMEQLKSSERFYYSDSDEGREAILDDYRAIIDEMYAGLDQAFTTIPEAEVAVKRIPEFKEKTAPGAYYQSPAMDGSRPGVFYANLHDIRATPTYSMRTLAYHEAVPGHHFQQAVQREQEDLPFFRRVVPFTAYTEGWALYAERLAWEMGFQDDPYDNIGRLQAELFRAVRLVVDTGIHAQRWSREAAIAYLVDNTGIAESDAVSEIERYFVLPGQATAYKVGMTKILQLRDKAREALGERFDLKAFHEVVLTNGAVPLTILERLVDDYIAEASA